MSRVCSKEVMSDIYAVEIKAHELLIDAAFLRAEAAVCDGTLSPEAFDSLKKAQDMLKASDAMLKDEDFTKSLHFLIRSVANYYLMLGDKGVLRAKQP